MKMVMMELRRVMSRRRRMAQQCPPHPSWQASAGPSSHSCLRPHRPHQPHWNNLGAYNMKGTSVGVHSKPQTPCTVKRGQGLVQGKACVVPCWRRAGLSRYPHHPWWHASCEPLSACTHPYMPHRLPPRALSSQAHAWASRAAMRASSTGDLGAANAPTPLAASAAGASTYRSACGVAGLSADSRQKIRWWVWAVGHCFGA